MYPCGALFVAARQPNAQAEGRRGEVRKKMMRKRQGIRF